MQASVGSNAYSVIKEQIINLELEPGEKISESELGSRLEVSRTPIREAFKRLAQEGLIDIYPQRGSFVSQIDESYVEEGRFMREHMELAVIELACQKIPNDYFLDLEESILLQEKSVEAKNYKRLFQLDEYFHQVFFLRCDKERTWTAVQNMMANLNRTRMLSLASEFNWEMIVLQHKQILEAVAKKDPDKAKAIMKEHLTMVNVDITKLKLQYGSYFKNK